MTTITRTLALAALALLLASPPDVEAQISGSIAAGVANPLGDFGDTLDSGFTFRGQAGISLLLVGLHAQVGWTRFPGKGGGGIGFEGADFFHAGAGGRVGLGMAWVGLTGAWFSGDGEDGLGLLPEVGLGLGPVEAVVDARVDGDAKWFAVRLGVRL